MSRGLERAFCFLLIVMAAALAGVARADTLIDFDDPASVGLTPNSSFQGSLVVAGAELTNQYLNLGVIFSTHGGEPYAALVDLTGQAPSGNFGVGPVSTAGGGSIDYGSPLDIFFFMPGTSTPAMTTSISIQGDEEPIPGNVIYSAYDADGNLLGSFSSPDTAGGVYAISSAAIHEFRIYSTSSTVAYDNLTFGPLSPVPQSSAPEPSAAWLMAAGCVALWASRKLRLRHLTA